MANLTLVYGVRLLPSEDVVEVGDAPVKLSNGHEARWSGTSDAGARVRPGVYFVRLAALGAVRTARVAVVE